MLSNKAIVCGLKKNLLTDAFLIDNFNIWPCVELTEIKTKIVLLLVKLKLEHNVYVHGDVLVTRGSKNSKRAIAHAKYM